jgi:hypothetical protein
MCSSCPRATLRRVSSAGRLAAGSLSSFRLDPGHHPSGPFAHVSGVFVFGALFLVVFLAVDFALVVFFFVDFFLFFFMCLQSG